MVDVYRDKIIINGWKSLQSLVLKTVIFFFGKAKFVAVKFIKIQNSIYIITLVNKMLKEGFIKLKRVFSFTALISVSAVKYITKIPTGTSISSMVKILAYKTFTSLMEINIGFVAKTGFNLYLLFFPKTHIGIGVTINDRLLTSEKFIKTQAIPAMKGIVKVSSNMPFYLKHLDPIKLKDMDRYMLNELDGNV